MPCSARRPLALIWQVFVYCELEVHFCDILLVGNQTDPKQHYNFFRRRLAGTVPETALEPHCLLTLRSVQLPSTSSDGL